MGALHSIIRKLTHSGVLIGLGVFSIVAVAATFVLVPMALTRMRADYFTHPHAKRGHLALAILKNVAGVLLVLLGIAMLVLPGQGVLTVLLGLGLVDFPGRRKLQLRVITRPAVLRTINALRRRARRPPLEIPSAIQK